jgi:hypothetical protein
MRFYKRFESLLIAAAFASGAILTAAIPAPKR